MTGWRWKLRNCLWAAAHPYETFTAWLVKDEVPWT